MHEAQARAGELAREPVALLAGEGPGGNRGLSQGLALQRRPSSTMTRPPRNSGTGGRASSDPTSVPPLHPAPAQEDFLCLTPPDLLETTVPL